MSSVLVLLLVVLLVISVTSIIIIEGRLGQAQVVSSRTRA